MGHLHRGGDIGNLRQDAARADPGAQSADGDEGDIRTIGTSEPRLPRGGTPVAFVPIMFYTRERLDKGISMRKVVPIRPDMAELGSAQCSERVCPQLYLMLGALPLKKNNDQ